MNKFLLVLILLFSCNFCYAELIQDDFVNETLINIPEQKVHKEYDYTNLVKIPVRLSIKEAIKSEDDLYEGQEIEFVVKNHVSYKNAIFIKKGETVKANVSVIITPGMNGIPASIIFDNFRVRDISSNQLSENYEIFGQDRSWLVFPLKWSLTILPPTGSFTNFIMGGHAKLKQNKVITIYYYPRWV